VYTLYAYLPFLKQFRLTARWWFCSGPKPVALLQ